MTPITDTLQAALDALGGDVVERLGWTLIHSLWQGLAVAALLAVTLFALRRRTPQARHAASLAALLLLAASPAVTFVLVPGVRAAPARTPIARMIYADLPIPVPQKVTADMPVPHQPGPMLVVEAPPPTVRDRLQALLPWLVATWGLGVAALSVWHLGGWLRVRRLKRTGTRPLDAAWQRRLADLCRTLRVARPVRLLESSLVHVPVVAGWLRPVILVPAAALSGLSPRELEAILAHELAHVRRNDYLVNVLQAVVETLLFYHPAVWWVSNQVRREREDCCDDDAAHSCCGGAIAYARALASLEELRPAGAAPGLALAASGSPLLRRVRRLVGRSPARSSGASRRVASLAVVALGATLALAPAAVTRLRAEAGPTETGAGKSEHVPTPAVLEIRAIDHVGAKPGLPGHIGPVAVRAVKWIRVAGRSGAAPPPADGAAVRVTERLPDDWVRIEAPDVAKAPKGSIIAAMIETAENRTVECRARYDGSGRVELPSGAARDAGWKPVEANPPAGAKAAVFTLKGAVTDADTGKPIDGFRVVLAPADEAEGRAPARWQEHTISTHSGGAFEIPLERSWPFTRVRVDAPGYLPAVSRVIEKQDGVVTVDLALRRAADVRGVVLSPDGKPVAGARVARATVTNEITVGSGSLYPVNLGSPFGAFTTTAEDGSFSLPPEVDPGVVVVAHFSGYAELPAEQFTDGKWLTLEPAGVVRGPLMIPRGPDDSWSVYATRSRPDGDAPCVLYQAYANVAPGGDSYELTDVAPGRTQVGVRVNAGNGGFCPVTGTFADVDVPAGGTATVALGGGRPVTGRVVAAGKPAGAMDFSKVKLRLVLEAPHVGMPGDEAMWRAYQSFIGGPRRDLYTRDFVPGRDGSFRLDGVPQGRYQLVGPVKSAGLVVVEPITGATGDQPLDLGDLPLAGEAPPKDGPGAEDGAGVTRAAARLAELELDVLALEQRRDVKKAELDRLSLTLPPAHGSIVALKDTLADLDLKIEQTRREIRQVAADADQVSAAERLTPTQIARTENDYAALLRRRDALKAELEKLTLKMLPQHPTVVKARQELGVVDGMIDQKAEVLRRSGVVFPPQGAGQPAPAAKRQAEAVSYYIGGVPRPGAYQLGARKVNLLQALVAAGFDVNANAGERVKLFRRGEGDGRETVTNLIVRDLLEHRDRDVFLQADDTVLVGERRDPAPGDDGDKPDGKKAEPADAKKKKVSVLLVSPDNYFLAKAVSALPGADVKLMGVEGYPLDPEPRYDVIIYDRVGPPKYPARGNFICIGTVPPRGLRLREVPDPGSDKLPDGRQRPVRVQEVAVDRWERDHPILRGLDLGKLFVESAGRVAPAEGSEVLVTGKGDPAVPLVVLHREEGRTFLVLPFSVLDSNWPIKVSFPVFLKQAVDYLAGQGRNE